MKRVFYNQYTNFPSSIPEVNNDPSLAWQHCKDECDIRCIVKKPNLGLNPFEVPTRKPMVGDFTTAVSFQEAQNLIIKAQEQFAALSSDVRDKFGNDPSAMLSFVENPDNFDACVELGIFEKPSEPEKAAPDAVLSPVDETSAH